MNQVRNWTSWQTVGDVFKKYAPFFKVYTVYANRFDEFRSLIKAVTSEDNPKAKVAEKIIAGGAAAAAASHSSGTYRY